MPVFVPDSASASSGTAGRFVPDSLAHSSGVGTFVPDKGGPGVITTRPAHPPPKSGGGFLGDVGHFFSQTGSDLVSAAVHAPGGIYQAGKAFGADVTGGASALAHGQWNKAFNPTQSHFYKQVAKPAALATAQDFQHPLRRPGFTLLDLLAFGSAGAGAVARVGAAGRALGAAGEVGAGARLARTAGALAKTPAPESRALSHGGFNVPAPALRNPLMRQAQKLLDRARMTFPEAPLGRRLPSKVGFEAGLNRAVGERIAQFPAVDVRTAGRNLSAAEQTALRVHAEGIPVQERIAFHQKQIAMGVGSAAGHTRQIKLLQIAQKQHLGPDGVTLASKQLQNVYAKMTTQAAQETATKKGLGLSEEAAASRPSAPGQVIRHGERLTGGEVSPQLSLLEPTSAEPFQGGQLRVPYAASRLRGQGRVQAGTPAGVSMKTRPLGSISHPFTGGHLQSGRFRADTTNLMAESGIEAERHAAILRAKTQIAQAAHEYTGQPNEVPVNLGVLKRMPESIKALQQRYEEGGTLTKDETRALGMSYDTLRQEVFPPKDAALRDVQGYKWIDSRLLGGLNEPNPLTGLNMRGNKFLRSVDAVNNAQKSALIYLRPAHLITRGLSNVSMNLLHEGFAAPKHLAHAARANLIDGPVITARIDHVMGKGGVAAVAPEGGGLTRATGAATQGLYRLVGNLVDERPRRAAFYYEAKLAGYGTKAERRALLMDPANRTDLIRVTRRAEDAVGTYDRLGPYEKAVVRRIIFIYPWLKVATRITNRTLLEHPIKAAVAGQLGRQAQKGQESLLGAVPSYAEGIFGAGRRGGLPLTVNAGPANIFETPAQLGQVLAGLGRGHAGSAFAPFTELNPLWNAALTALMRRDLQTGRALKGSPAGNFVKQLYRPLPFTTLANRMRETPAERGLHVYPETPRDVLLHYLLGLTPRPYNPALGQQAAAREKLPQR